MDAAPIRLVYRFATFEADPATGELRKAGVRLRLPEQPFRVLIMMLERPGELVTREEIRQKLWPADTFVDFDHGLNTVINRLRETLGDSAANPHFIETLARRGYRFLATVDVTGPATAAAAPSAAPVEPISPPAESRKINGAVLALNGRVAAVLTRPEDVPAVPRRYVRVLFLLIQIMYLCFYIAALARLRALEDLLESAFTHWTWMVVVLVVTAAVGIPIRLYLLAAVSFDVRGLTHKFHRLFPFTFVLDELWALAPFLLLPQIGLGLALAASAALIYVPFSQRTVLLMGDAHAQRPPS
ncbi:MAG TPA: winged helix-turn-helix domain-containing protein [Terriglobales bacterium]|jgi:DNA-binding winged helix-turn-helix (wHTH) protein|nr:winged helix-turn-helix domain-containing protein [Terriglobales bacterium]